MKPKDIAITDNGIVLVLNDDGSVKKFGGKTQPHQMYEEIKAKGSETIAFHSPSKHVLIANRSDGIVQVSVFSECSELVTSFHVYEDKDVQEKKEYIAPRIAVTADGRIAVLNGFAGESKVTVVNKNFLFLILFSLFCFCFLRFYVFFNFRLQGVFDQKIQITTSSTDKYLLAPSNTERTE